MTVDRFLPSRGEHPASGRRPGAVPALLASTLREAAEYLRRPYPVTLSMVVLVSLIPFYVVIPAVLLPGRTLHVPAIRLDGIVPLQPGWVFVYAALYLFLIVVPVLVIRDEQHIRRTVRAYLFVWLCAYAVFIAYPTVASRPAKLEGSGFGVWGLELLYSADPPYNCFPSLHVAHSFVSALTCLRLHRPLGLLGCGAALLVSVSTILTKQHYVLDVAAGIVLAAIAYVAFLRKVGSPTTAVPARRAVTALAIGLLGFVVALVGGAWVVHRWRSSCVAPTPTVHGQSLPPTRSALGGATSRARPTETRRWRRGAAS